MLHCIIFTSHSHDLNYRVSHPAPATNITRLVATMSQFRAKYPTIDHRQRMKFAVHEIGSLKDCKFYTSTRGFEKDGLAFRAAYDAATDCTNKMELCTYVGSMLCAVSSDLTNSVVEALHGVGVEPLFVELPSQALAHGKEEDEVTEMDWPSILIYFPCICIILLKNVPSLSSYETFMSKCIRELQKKIGLEQGFKLKVPFDSDKADSIRTMLGACLALRTTLITFIMGTMDNGRSSINSVCQYLFDVLSWSGMDELVLMNELLLVPNSHVLHNPEHSREVQDLREACAAIQAHPYPQFFMHLASNADLLKVDLSRFPNLIKIVEKMEYEGDCDDIYPHLLTF